MVSRMGVVTIGQTPRPDMAEMHDWLGQGVEVMEAGALDGLTAEAVPGLAPGPGDEPLVTRLQDGSAVVVGRQRIVGRVQAAIHALEEAGAQAVLLACTGEFPPFSHRRPLLPAERLLRHGVLAMASGARVAVLCPVGEQVELMREKWSGLTPELAVFAASPYGEPGELAAAAGAAREWEPELVVMDCMGYTRAMKKVVVRTTGAPALLARSLVARLAAELVD